MTVQLRPSEPTSAVPSGVVEKAMVTEPEYAVLQHLTAAWNAFLQLPAERVEYIVAFQAGCQQLQKQITERGENRSDRLIAIPPLDGAATRPVLAVTIEERKRRRDERHLAAAKARRARQLAEDPDAVRAKERERWRKKQERKREKAAEEKAVGATREVPKRPAKKTPRAKSSAEYQRNRYASDPEYRAARQRANREWRAKTGYGQRSTRVEARDRQKIARQARILADPAFAERQRELKRASNAKYRAALRALKTSKAPAGEVRMYQLQADPIYAAAHAAVPPSMAEFHRADIVSDIILAVIENRISLADVPKLARSFITAHHRRAETYATVSMDALIGDGHATRHDFISQGMWESTHADE